MSSSVAPLPAARSGPLHTGHTSKSSKRLSTIDPSRRKFGCSDTLHHDAEQRGRFAAFEGCAHRHIPMPLIGQRTAFYGILFGHEHRLVVGKEDVLTPDASMVGERVSHHFDSVSAQHVEEAFRIADAGDGMYAVACKVLQGSCTAPAQRYGVSRLEPHAERAVDQRSTAVDHDGIGRV